MKITTTKIALQSFLFAVAWCLYMIYVMPFADQIAGPCEGTPGHDYSMAFVILPLYLLVFGGWIFYLTRTVAATKTKLGLSILALFVFPLIFAIGIGSFFFNEGVIAFIREQGAFDLFYNYGCYGDTDVRNLPVCLITAICVGVPLFFLLNYTLRSRNK